MAIIERSIRLEGSKGTKEVVAIFDSGSTYSCIQPEVAQALETVTALPKQMRFETAEVGKTLVADEVVRLDFYINGFRLSDEFMVIPGLSGETIIGATTLQKWRMKLDFEHDDVVVDPRVTKLRLL